MQTGLITQGDAQVRFSQANTAEENDIGFVGDELQAEQMFDRHLVNGLGPLPVKLFEGFWCWETGQADAPFPCTLLTVKGFLTDQFLQVLQRSPPLLGRLLCQRLIQTLNCRQFEVAQLLLELFCVDGLVGIVLAWHR